MGIEGGNGMKTGRVYGPREVVGEEVQGMLMRTCQFNVGARFNSAILVNVHACSELNRAPKFFFLVI